jgi:hypothetical protein
LGGSFTRIPLEDIAPTKHELAVTTGGRMPEQVAIGYIRAVHRANGGRRRLDAQLPQLLERHTMNARITFSLFGFHVGVIDLAIDLDGVLDIPEREVTKATQVTRKAVKGISQLWVRGMVY